MAPKLTSAADIRAAITECETALDGVDSDSVVGVSLRAQIAALKRKLTGVKLRTTTTGDKVDVQVGDMVYTANLLLSGRMAKFTGDYGAQDPLEMPTIAAVVIDKITSSGEVVFEYKAPSYGGRTWYQTDHQCKASLVFKDRAKAVEAVLKSVDNAFTWIEQEAEKAAAKREVARKDVATYRKWAAEFDRKADIVKKATEK